MRNFGQFLNLAHHKYHVDILPIRRPTCRISFGLKFKNRFFFLNYAVYPLGMPFEEMLVKTRNACENTASDHPHSRVCNR